MEKQVTTPKKDRQRKFMLVLPVLALPFLTMLFWSMGGGRAAGAVDGRASDPAGFNRMLPDANLKDDGAMDKMAYYDQAAKDSLEFLELLKNDPNYKGTVIPDSSRNDAMSANGRFSKGANPLGLNASVYGGSRFNDPHSEKIYQKLALLNKELNSSSSPADNRSMEGYGMIGKGGSSLPGSEVDRLEQMMKMMSSSDGEDAEMSQLSALLEKIIDIQHPERVQQKLEEVSSKQRGKIYAVAGKKNENIISILDKNNENRPVGFFSIDEADAIEEQNTIKAAIHEDQVIVSGSTVKLRLLDEIVVNGNKIPKNTFLFGTASLDGERLGIEINSIQYKNSLFPVELTVYDIDGLEGIRIPGAIARDVAKQSVDRSLQSFGMASLDPTLTGQAAGAGIEAVKSLASKKVKLVKVMVKAGYNVLLRDEKNKQ